MNLRVATGDDDGVGALAIDIVQDSPHLQFSGQAGSSREIVGGEEGFIVHSLDSQVTTESLAELVAQGLANDGTLFSLLGLEASFLWRTYHVSELGRATSPDEDDRLASTADAGGELILSQLGAVELTSHNSRGIFHGDSDGRADDGGSKCEETECLHVC